MQALGSTHRAEAIQRCCCWHHQRGTPHGVDNARRSAAGQAARAHRCTSSGASASADRSSRPEAASAVCAAAPVAARRPALGAAAVAAALSAAAAATAATDAAVAAAGGPSPAAQDAAAAAAAAAAAVANGTYVPSPVEVGWEIWAGFIAGVVPFLIASWEFGKRVVIQRRCPTCQGRGLVKRGRYLRKCSECGGMLPWLGWRYFFLSTATPGNGGPLLQPRGQTSIFYKVPPPPPKKQQQQQQGDVAAGAAGAAAEPVQVQGERQQAGREAVQAGAQQEF